MVSGVTQTVDDLLGTEPSSEMLESDYVDSVAAAEILKKVKNEGFVKNARVRSLANLGKLREKYECYYSSIKKALEGKEGSQAELEDFRDVLPSKEHFWQVMIEAGLLKDVKKYVVIDFKELEKLSGEWPHWNNVKRLLEHLKGSKDGHDAFEGLSNGTEDKSVVPKSDQVNRRMCLYPEQVGGLKNKEKHFKVMALEDFVDAFGSLKGPWGSLVRKGIVLENQVATMRCDDEAKKIRLDAYDDIEETDFKEIIGVETEMSKQMFEHLLTEKVLAKKGGETELDSSKLDDLTCPDGLEHFQTEFKNIVRRSFKYRLALEDVRKHGHFGEVTLHSDPHHELWADLVANCIVEPALVDPELDVGKLKGCLERAIEESSVQLPEPDPDAKLTFAQQMAVYGVDGVLRAHKLLVGLSDNPKDRVFVEAMINQLKKAGMRSEVASKLSDRLESARSSLPKLECPESKLKPLEECFEKEDLHRKAQELEASKANGMSDIIVLNETPWTAKAIKGMLIVAALGLAQIVLGVVITFFTLGWGTFVGGALVAEGFSDLIYAGQCAYSGYFSWKGYLVHKAISVAFTALAFGIGAWLSQGAKHSAFGFQIGGQLLSSSGKSMSQMAGRELLKEVGKMAILRAALYQVGKKAAQTAGVWVLNR